MSLSTVITKIKRNDFRLLHSGISSSKKEQRRKLFRLKGIYRSFTWEGGRPETTKLFHFNATNFN